MATLTNKRPTQAKRVLTFLRARGHHGVYNYEFIEQHILRAASRVDELRKLGYDIQTVRVGNGIFKYVLKPEAEVNDAF